MLKAERVEAALKKGDSARLEADIAPRFSVGDAVLTCNDHPPFALTLACGALGKWNIDMSRFARERLHPQLYLQTTYYEKWLLGLQSLLIENEFLTQAEIDQRMSDLKNQA